MAKVANPRNEIQEIRSRLKAAGLPQAAKLAKAATRSPHSFYGVLPPQVRALAREIARRHRHDRGFGPLRGVAQALWKSRWHEERSVAIQLLATFARRLEADDWTLLKAWLEGVRSADHCDGIAVELVGSLVKRDRTWVRVLKHWTLSKSVWLRRASIMGVLLRTRQMGDVDSAFYVSGSLMQDKSTLVQEGVGAVLAEAWNADRPLTQKFLDRWKGKTARTLPSFLPA